MSHFSLKSILLTGAFLALPVFVYVLWPSSSDTLALLPKDFHEIGTQVKQDFQSIPTLPLTQTTDAYQVSDTGEDGIEIRYADKTDPAAVGNKGLNLSFPKDYSQPIEVKLDDTRTVKITDLSGKKNYQVDTLAPEPVTPTIPETDQNFFRRLFSKGETLTENYLRYQSQDGRKEILYAYQKDRGLSKKQLKHWTLYKEGNGVEHEEYQIDQAKVKVNSEGAAEVFYYGDQELKSDQVAADVDQNLMERAQRTIAKDMGEDIMGGTAGKTPDFTIPAPYYIDRDGQRHEATWQWHEETKSLSVNFTPESYPVALDPTLTFTVPGVSNNAVAVIASDGTANAAFGYSLEAGDFNADGRIDLVVAANNYQSAGRIYFFYNDGGYPSNALGADATISAVTSNGDLLGQALAAGDFNSDGRTDLAVGLYHNITYIYYNDGSYPTAAASADIIITGEASSEFGHSLAAGDWNGDGRTDLAVGAWLYSSSTGRAYVFYNDGVSLGTTVCTTGCLAANADAIMTGETASDLFGRSMFSGDFNADGKADLIVSATGYSSTTGRAYIFYGGSVTTENASGADVILTGAATGNFGAAFTAADFNADGLLDLAVGANTIGSSVGRVYIFYGGSITTKNASSADVTITNSTSSGYFGGTLASGDMNADGRADLIVSTTDFSTANGAIYIFYGDGSIPTNANVADVAILGESAGNGSGLGYALRVADFNNDGRPDLATSSSGFNLTGRAYIFFSQNGVVSTNQTISGNATGDQFGYAATAGDFNADGRMDLAVGAPGYNPGAAANTGRAYIFYGDGQIPTGASTADVTITGEAASNYFGWSLTAGDFDSDGDTDLAVGAKGYSSSTGRTYIFYNDNSIPTTAATADVTITGNATSDTFGYALAAGDFTGDGRVDLAVGAQGYSTNTGRTYIFYNDNSIPTTAATADVTITGETTNNYFGWSLAAGDFTGDGRVDLAVGAKGYSTNTGRTYIFNNDNSIPTTAATADTTITGEATSDFFGWSLAAGDLNGDGRTDLVAGGKGYNSGSFSGRAYVFYNDGSLATAAGSADVIINASGFDSFAYSVGVGDLNADGKADLIVGAFLYAGGAGTGRAYVFYADGSTDFGRVACTGSAPAVCSGANADVILTGDSSSQFSEGGFVVADLSGDGRNDLVVLAEAHTSSTGKVFLYEGHENFSWTLQKQPQPTTTSAVRTGVNGSGQELQITGEAGSSFGQTFTTGDFNADGRTDLVVGAYGYASSTGRVYIFYGDGDISTGATSADVVITGETTSDKFGFALAAGDFNQDGKTDLVASSYGYNFGEGRVYIFYNDGSLPATAATADVTIAGETASSFGYALAVGDFDSTGTADLAVGGRYYSGDYTGRVYVFNNDLSIPTTAATADTTITGSVGTYFGNTLAAGDFDADGDTDLAVSAIGYSSTTGRVYIFYNDGSLPTTSATADVTITGGATGNQFGIALAVGDVNTDGKADLVVGANQYSTNTGRAYIFYGGSITTEDTTGADVTITGNATSNYFGSALAVGDFNRDSRTDLAVGAYGYTTNTGRVYIFNNDGSLPTTAATADTTLTGNATSNYYGAALAAGDFNTDGQTDLAVGAYGYSSSTGRTYLYTFNDPVIVGEATSNVFGFALTTGDYNSDGRTDLAVGAKGYSTNTGRVYVFYNDGAIPSLAASADAIMTGETTSNYFGYALTSGDLNADGKTDLAASAYGNTSLTGKVYIFYGGSITTESASGADVSIAGTGVNSGFGGQLAAGDVNNADGKTDLIVGTIGNQYVYVFYNDGSYPASASTADVTISGGSIINSLVTGDFNQDGKTDFAVGDYWPSGGDFTGKVYVFYGDGSIPTTMGTADVTITGEAASSYFGYSLAAGDFNTDGKTDLAVGAYRYNPGGAADTGRTYIFYGGSITTETAAGADVTITGQAASDRFGSSLAAGDWNGDGRTDLAVSAYLALGNTGKAYIFYNDGSIPTTAATADILMTGNNADVFGSALVGADLNSDGKLDLIVGAYNAASTNGKVYLFTSEVAATSRFPGTSYLKGTGKLKGTGQLK